ncbi:hypothetical protein BJ6T_20920 [Bradyrhizobium japonicum USDA 6]|nr:hypothetical protein BJ6T_20920 [Bradyrhizobium japonicum USDA 6]
MRSALAERSGQIISASCGVSCMEGQRLNASIDIWQLARPSRAVRGRAALHLGISGQGTQRKRRSDRGRYPASVRSLSRRRRRALTGIHHRDLRVHGAYGHRSSLPDLSEDVRQRARNLAGDRRGTAGTHRRRARAVRELVAAGRCRLGSRARAGACNDLPHGWPHPARPTRSLFRP